MFNPKSDYALNKLDREAIVYMDVTGALVRLTVEDFSSEAEFFAWKAWSDENYHTTEKAEHIEANHTLSLYGLSEMAIAVPSPEDQMMETQEQRERQELRRLLMEGLDTCLTASQRRRLWLFYMDGLTETDIAIKENVAQPSISRSISAAKKKLKKLLTDWV